MGAAGSTASSGEPAPTFAVELRAVLELPTETPTATPRPTESPTPDALDQVDFCKDEQPGQVCRVPCPPPPTPTPYPSCDAMGQLQPGTWCHWPDGEPTPVPVWIAEGRPHD